MSSYLALKIGYTNKTHTHTYTKWSWKLSISILAHHYKSVFSVLSRGKKRPKTGQKRQKETNRPFVVVSLFSQTHAWVSRVASHATALNIGIIIFIQCNHSSRFRTSLLNTVFRAQKKPSSLRLHTFLLEMWWRWWRKNNRNVAVVVVVVEGKQ